MDTQSFDYFDNKSFQRFTNPAVVEKDLQVLVGILKGIKSDKIINDIEYSETLEWISSHKQYEDKQPYKEIISVIRSALEDNILTQEEIDNIIWYCNQYIHRTDYFDTLTSGIQKLLGILKGISIDNEINIQELEYLDKWMEDHSFLKNTWPYDELYNLTTNIIQDKIITEQENTSLINFANAIVGNTKIDSNANLLTSITTGYYQIDPQITIQNNTFCITGISKQFKRREIAEKIELYGGYVVENISSKLNYLIVCDEKNACWAYTCYGRKIEEAIKHRKQGVKLIIVHEYDLYDALEDL